MSAANFKNIRAVTFDVGGTLVEPWPSVGHVYAEVAADHGLAGMDVQGLNQRFARAWRARDDFDYSQESWFELVRESFGDAAAALPEVFYPAVYRRFEEPDAWRLHDDVLAAFDHLASRGIALGVVSNWDERLRPLLDSLKLSSYLEAVIVSHEIGFTKPSPVIFEQASRKLGLPADAILHVGDSQEEDVVGARNAGLSAFWLRRNGAGGNGIIGSLAELNQYFP